MFSPSILFQKILYFIILFCIYSIWFLNEVRMSFTSGMLLVCLIFWYEVMMFVYFMDVNCLFYFISFHFIIIHLFFWHRCYCVSYLLFKPLKALVLLCRGNLSGTDVIVHICYSKPLKALILWCRVSSFSFQFLGWKTQSNTCTITSLPKE